MNIKGKYQNIIRFKFLILRVILILFGLCILKNSLFTRTAWKKIQSGEKYFLVTGAAGFIGHHVVTRLIKDNFNVIGVDNFNDYYDVSLKYFRSNISKVVVNVDVCDSKKIRNILEGYKITHVIHLAAQAGVRYSIENPQAYIRSNIECFVSLLECIKMLNIPLIYASSSSVYGKNDRYPSVEEDRVISPVSLYAATKRENELIAHVYWSLYGQRSVGLRFFTVYGPIGRPDMAYFSFTKNIIDGKQIKVYQQGELFRDFTYIDDIVDGIIRCIDVSFNYEILNLGRGEPHSVREFLLEIEQIIGVSANILYTDLANGEVEKTYADISKAKAAIGYSPKVSLNKGLKKFIMWFNTWYKHKEKNKNGNH